MALKNFFTGKSGVKFWVNIVMMVLIIVAVIAIVLLETHSEEIGDWMMEEMTGGVESDLEQILG